MTKLSIDTTTMHPWHDISRLLSNAKSLKVLAGGRSYEGEATLVDDNDDGHLTLVFRAKRAKK